MLSIFDRFFINDTNIRSTFPVSGTNIRPSFNSKTTGPFITKLQKPQIAGGELIREYVVILESINKNDISL